MKLYYRKYGEVGVPLIIIHGLYGSGDNWAGIARELSEYFEVYAIDQRNHGRSPHDDVHSYEAMRDDLAGFMDRLKIRRAILLGHSMGGKTAMFFAERYPERVQTLISVDMGPGPYHDLAEMSHFAADHAAMMDAMLGLDLSSMEGREDIDRALAPHIGSDRIRGFLLKNVGRNENENFEWRINLKVLRKNLDNILDGLDITAISKKGGITGFPALFVAGERSDYIRPQDHVMIKSVFPAAEIVSIPNAGHWVHAEQPELLIKNIRYFLSV
ncbi:MAG: alpha/beta fold hydrolase [Bacteroidales bacterium]|nr:alpha/beta fold hydrolase [Bacteroidales bacterium]